MLAPSSENIRKSKIIQLLEYRFRLSRLWARFSEELGTIDVFNGIKRMNQHFTNSGMKSIVAWASREITIVGSRS